MEMGWTPALFGSFDASVGSRGRDSHKPERFGKKYQWIALFELLARLTDNFTYHDWGTVKAYEGAWQLHLRDLDPTLSPEGIEVGDDEEYAHASTFPVDRLPAWWCPDEPTFDDVVQGEEGRWAELTADLPTPDRLLRVTDPGGVRWVVVEGYHSWREDPDDAPSVVCEAGPDRDLAVLTSAALIRRRDVPKLLDWLSDSTDLLRSLPDWGSQGIYGAFWSELPAESESHGYPVAWRRRGGTGRLPVRSAAVSIGYSGESNSRDCSLTTSVSVDLPSEYLARLGGLEWSGIDAAWVDRGGSPQVRYHETDEGFHRDHVLMVREEALEQLLKKHELALAIGMFSERRVFDSQGRSMPKALGWVDYVGYLLYDGETWDSAELHPYERHASADDADLNDDV
jgi:hypothetical protein